MNKGLSFVKLSCCKLLAISALVGCGAENSQISTVSDSTTISLIKDNSLSVEPLGFHQESSQSVNCLMLGHLSELVYEGKATGTNCGHIDKNGLIKFTPEFMGYGPISRHPMGCELITQDGPNSHQIRHGWFFIGHNGYGRGHNEHYSNECSFWKYLPEVSKTYIGGKLAYFNNNMTILYQSDFVYGEEFTKDGLAIVCSKRPEDRIGLGSEKIYRTGGLCGQVDTHYNLVTPTQQPYEDFNPIPVWEKPHYARSVTLIAKQGKGVELRSILKSTYRNFSGLEGHRFRTEKSPDKFTLLERWDSRESHAQAQENPKFQAALEAIKALTLNSTITLDKNYDTKNK